MVLRSHTRSPASIALVTQSVVASRIQGEGPPPQGSDGKGARCPAGYRQSPATRPLRAHPLFAHAVSLSTAGRGGPEPRPTLEPRRRGFPRHREPPPTLGPRHAAERPEFTTKYLVVRHTVIFGRYLYVGPLTMRAHATADGESLPFSLL